METSEIVQLFAAFLGLGVGVMLAIFAAAWLWALFSMPLDMEK